jgi:Flp pilus assembly protein TadG
MTTLTRFFSDKRGSFSVLVSLLIIPLIVFAGGAIDYSRLVSVRSKLQSASDATALALAKEAANLTQAELEAKGAIIFDALLGGQGDGMGFSRTGLSVVKGNKTVTISVAGAVPATLMKLVGVPSMDVKAGSASAWGTRKIEVALVLDNTGSMASASKLVELKKAAKNLITTLQGVAKEPGAVKIGIVPFTTQVRLDTSNKNASWLDFATYGVNKNTWNGCVTDRDQPSDVTDTGAALFPAVNCAAGTLATIRPLSEDYDALRTAIDGMVAGGNTNVTIGLSWGLAALSAADPLTGGAAYGTDGVEKFMIMLTDGDNTQNRWTTNQTQIDTRTTAACNEIKLPAKNIRLYTIRVINGNQTLLRNCATNTGMYYDVTSASQLTSVFQKIADEIAAIRLTS